MVVVPLSKTPEPEVEQDEELGELPPLDGEGDDVEPPVEDLEDDGPEELNLLDDATGEADPVDDTDLPAAMEGGLEDAEGAEDLDVGGDDLDDLDHPGQLDDADEPGVGDEDFGLDVEGAALAGDAGEEGPEGADEDLREEDLPRLDADDDGELEDDAFAEVWPGVAEDERPPWDDRAWERAAAALAEDAGMVRCVVPLDADQVAVVGGATVLRVSPVGVRPLGGAVGEAAIHGAAIAGVAGLSDGAVVAATGQGDVWLVDEASARELSGVRALAAGSVVELAAQGDRIWARTADGALLASADRGERWELLAADSVLAATATPAGELVAVTGLRARANVVRGAALAAWGPPLPPFPEGARPIVRARGNVVVVGALGAGAFRSEGGGPWTRLEGTSGVTALTLLDDDGTTLVALHAPSEDRSWIARAGADGVARIVIELGGEGDEGDDPRVLDLAWSDASRMAWAVGPFGVALLRPL
jgi:hypothetical protein